MSFNFELDPESASNVASFAIEQWNYKWQHNYGSAMYHPKTDEKGKESLSVAAVKLAPDQRSIKLVIPDLEPVNQLHLRLKMKAFDDQEFVESIYWTINRVPGR